MTAAQHNRSANRNKYSILKPFEANIKTRTESKSIIIFVLFFTCLPFKDLFTNLPSIIIKLEIALINVSIVLKVKDIAKINIAITIAEFFLSNSKSNNARSGITFEFKEKDNKPV